MIFRTSAEALHGMPKGSFESDQCKRLLNLLKSMDRAHCGRDVSMGSSKVYALTSPDAAGEFEHEGTRRKKNRHEGRR